MNSFYVVGGQVRHTLFRRLEEWQACERGLVIELDPITNKSRICADYVSPPEVRPPNVAATQFKSATLQGNQLYTCTSTEVLVYGLPGFKLENQISLPFFNDLHHVYPSHSGTLLVVVTGLDLVVEITIDGQVVREWDVLSQDTWQKFSRRTDYRLVPSTKPHPSHPNHVFELENEVWVTRLEQRDAICLSRPGPRIDIAVEKPHDGYVFGDRIYFTTVDGHIVVANSRTLKVEQTVDLNQISGSRQVLGWCRGVLPLNDDYVWAGFTRVRPTRFVQNVSWIKNRGSDRHKPSHLALYNLKHGTCEQEIELEPHGIGVVFSLLPISGAD